MHVIKQQYAVIDKILNVFIINLSNVHSMKKSFYTALGHLFQGQLDLIN